MESPDRIAREEHGPAAAPPVSAPDPAPAKREGDPLTDPDESGGSRQGVPDEPVGPEAPEELAGSAASAGQDGGASGQDAGLEPPAGAGPDEPPADAAPEDRAAEYLALAQRTQADFENFRKRMNREVRAAEARGVAKAARELLPALDHLALALENLEGPALEGLRLVQRELLAALARLGIEPYSPKGETFDPQVHEAVSQLAVEGMEAGTVFEVMQHGYRHGEAVLRPARVVVAG